MTDNLFKKSIAGHNTKGTTKTTAKSHGKSTTKAKAQANSKPSVSARALAQAAQKPKPDPSQISAIGETLSSPPPLLPKKRGRPANGKRSNEEWLGRTYYILREVDIDVAMELLKLRRRGIEIDKSELVDTLLSAWLTWRSGGELTPHIAKVTPR